MKLLAEAMMLGIGAVIAGYGVWRLRKHKNRFSAGKSLVR